MKDPQLWSSFVELFPTIVSNTEEYNAKCDYAIKYLLRSGTNVLLYSVIGFPLDLFVNVVATRMFGPFTKKECLLDKSVVYYETPFFIEIDFSHPQNKKSFDAIEDVIKSIVSTVCIHSESHLIICKNIDNITSMYAFRVLLERFNKNARFLCTTYTVSAIEAPIRSRFMEIRIPLFTKEQVKCIMTQIGGTADLCNDETINCRNILKYIAIVDLKSKGHDISLTSKYNYPLIKAFMDKKSHTVLDIRDFANRVCTHCIPFSQVVVDLQLHVADQYFFIERAAQLEHDLVTTNRGRKPLYFELLFYIAIYGKTNKNKYYQ